MVSLDVSDDLSSADELLLFGPVICDSYRMETEGGNANYLGCPQRKNILNP